MHQAHTPPEYWKTAFHCPNCGVYANQVWGDQTTFLDRSERRLICSTNSLSAAICVHCDEFSLWLEEKRQMIYPFSGIAPLPNPDLPEHIAEDYLEARDIASISPRGAAALLRLCIQKLCLHLGEPGKDLNTDIGALVKKGLNPGIQKSLDIVRVIGNESVHPGTIDLRDDPQTTARLFILINIIADALITQPKMIEETYGIIPDGKRKGIESRDIQSQS